METKALLTDGELQKFIDEFQNSIDVESMKNEFRAIKVTEEWLAKMQPYLWKMPLDARKDEGSSTSCDKQH